jgi:hypothetical protein
VACLLNQPSETPGACLSTLQRLSRKSTELSTHIDNEIPSFSIMAPFWGLRGTKLHAAVWVESFFGVIIFGYNQSSMGGVLSFDNFERQFPQINTLTTKGAERAENARIQGTLSRLAERFLGLCLGFSP